MSIGDNFADFALYFQWERCDRLISTITTIGFLVEQTARGCRANNSCAKTAIGSNHNKVFAVGFAGRISRWWRERILHDVARLIEFDVFGKRRCGASVIADGHKAAAFTSKWDFRNFCLLYDWIGFRVFFFSFHLQLCIWLDVRSYITACVRAHSGSVLEREMK